MKRSTIKAALSLGVFFIL